MGCGSVSETNDTNAIPILGSIFDEFIVWKGTAYLTPELVDTASIVVRLDAKAHVVVGDNVMKSYQTARTHEGTEIFQILLDTFIAVIPINEEKVELIPTQGFEDSLLGRSGMGIGFNQQQRLRDFELTLDQGFNTRADLDI